MLNNKKRIFLYVSIILLILVGVYFVNSVGFANRNPLQTFVNATGESNGTVPGVGGPNWGDLVNWTKGGATETYRFTIDLDSYTAGTANNNVTIINISGTSLNSFPTGISLVQLSGLGNATFTTGSGANNNWTINVTSSYVSAFNQSYPIMGVNGLYGNITISFNVTVVNGTEAVQNWTVSIYNSTAGSYNSSGVASSQLVIDSGLGLLTGIDGLPPRANVTNVTDSTNTRTSFASTQYLKYDSTSPQQGVNITLSLTDYNIDRVLLVYNSTGGSINFGALRNLLYNVSFLSGNVSGIGFNVTLGQPNFTILENNGDTGGKANFTSLSTRSVLNPTATEYIFRFNISNNTWGLGASDGTTFNYVFVVYDLYNNSEIINNSNSAYTIARDVDRPTATLTEPTDTSIGVFDPIKYKCDGADSSALASCTAKISKPSGGTVSKTGCGTEQTFTTTDTNEAGTYTIECSTKDNVGRTNSKSSTFTVSAAGGGISAGGGVGGGGGGSREEAIEVPTGVTGDLGTLTTTNVYTSVSKDGSVSFVVAGSAHTVKVLEVTEDSATIEVSSTPSQFTLNVGQSQEVDVDDNGVNDLVVTLESITNGKADLVFKSTLEAAPPAEVPPEEVITGEEVRPSLTWLWVVLVIIVVILLIWYFSRRKR